VALSWGGEGVGEREGRRGKEGLRLENHVAETFMGGFFDLLAAPSRQWIHAILKYNHGVLAGLRI
jgi:hypothetical protein